ncbi:hypothetical protein NLG97_g3496 [Lecanicillium saksenae]|uniref:Uncharacterized protein n=1 Tax=Lecanicillium saksenae TaxID=468837 RepID=A0ACC1R0M1_9HYPO|nr:hypothetical protein NLG97_g3496 [Lecanicillium saksenae]
MDSARPPTPTHIGERIIRSVGVAGASGTVGRMVVEQLINHANVGSVVRLSRRDVTPSSPLKLAWDARTLYRAIDYSNVTSLRAGFEGLDVLIFPGSDGDPAQMLAHHRNVVQAATECEVGCFIYLSTLGAAQDSSFPYARVHGQTEEMLRNGASHMKVYVLRSSIFAEFFLDTFVNPAISAGALCLPVPSGRVSFVSREDVAQALVGAATGPADTAAGEQYTWNITGPTALTMGELCSVFAVERKQKLGFSEMSEAAYREQLSEASYEEWLIEAFATMLSYSIPGGHFSVVSTDVEQLSSLQAQTVAEVIRKTKPIFRADCDEARQGPSD